MNCREFDPGIERFCANPSDFVNAHQLVQMSTFFGIKGAELRKIKLIAAQEEESRSEALRIEAYSLTARETEESNLWSAKNSRVGNENQREVDRESQ